MLNNIKSIWLTFLILSFSTSKAQFQSGAFTSNFSGVMGVHVNPAGTSWLSDGADFLPFAISFEALNNNFYLPASFITNYINKSVLYSVSNDSTPENVLLNFKSRYKLKKDLNQKGFAHLNGIIYGPSLLINHRKRSFGFISSFKTYSSGVNLSPELVSFIFDSGEPTLINTDKPFKTAQFNFASISFLDLGYTNSNMVFNSAFDQVRLGFNTRFLLGFNAFFFRDPGSLYTINKDTSITFSNARFSYGFSFPKTQSFADLLSPRGVGAALDIGMLYIRKKYPSPTRVRKKCPNVYGYYRDYQTYKWRFGASITDLGALYFLHQTKYAKLENINYNYEGADSLIITALNKFDVNVRGKIATQPGVEFTEKNNFWFAVPTRFNIQFDGHLKKNWYLGLLLTQRLAIPNSIGIRSANIFTASLRYETQRYELAFPVSVVEYLYPTAGFYGRVGFIFFGTNTLPELLGLRNIRNVDFYFGLKLNIGFVGSRFGMGF